EHTFVAGLETGLTQVQPAKLILNVGIGSANVKHNFRAKVVEYAAYGRKQRGQILFIFDAIIEREIQVRRRLVSRIVVFLMDGEGEEGVVGKKNVRRAVAVVDVGIDNIVFFDSPLRLQAANANRHIVNRAKPFAMVRMRVVKSAAQVAG